MLSLDFTILVCSLLWQHAWPVLFSLYSCHYFNFFILLSLLEIPYFSPLTLVFPVLPDFAHSSSLLCSQCVLVCLFVRFHCPQLSFYCRKSTVGNYKKQVKQHILCLHTDQLPISVSSTYLQLSNTKTEILQHSQSSA